MKLRILLEEKAPEYKAIFMAGGTGSGKSFFIKKAIDGLGFKNLNPDKIYRILAKKEDIPIDSRKQTKEQIKKVEDLHNISIDKLKKKEDLLFNKGTSIVIDRTGSNSKDILELNNKLKNIGYNTKLIFIDTKKEIGLNRNQNRDRVVDPNYASQSYDRLEKNKEIYKKEFGKDFHLIDNSKKHTKGTQLDWDYIWIKLKNWAEN